MADIDSLDEDQDYVVLMTLHSAKGLEFPHVYLAGMEDGPLPSYMTITGGRPGGTEEERRLCYVGITRAEQKLTTSLRQKLENGPGETQWPNKMSRFIKGSRGTCWIRAAGCVHTMRSDDTEKTVIRTVSKTGEGAGAGFGRKDFRKAAAG